MPRVGDALGLSRDLLCTYTRLICYLVPQSPTEPQRQSAADPRCNMRQQTTRNLQHATTTWPAPHSLTEPQRPTAANSGSAHKWARGSVQRRAECRMSLQRMLCSWCGVGALGIQLVFLRYGGDCVVFRSGAGPTSRTSPRGRQPAALS
jgi:hypothetical protein